MAVPDSDRRGLMKQAALARREFLGPPARTQARRAAAVLFHLLADLPTRSQARRR